MSETFDFDSWIAGATVAEASVDIFQDGAVLGELAEWQRRYARASDEPQGERSAGEQSAKAALEAEGEALLERMRKSKTVWFVRALSTDEEIAIEAAHPLPKDPRKKWTEPAPQLIEHATEKQSEAYLVAAGSWVRRFEAFSAEQDGSEEYQAYLAEANAVYVARGVEKVARAFKRIEQDGKVLTSDAPTVEQIKRLSARIGEIQLNKIFEAITLASNAEPEIPADFLSPIFTRDRD